MTFNSLNNDMDGECLHVSNVMAFYCEIMT